jgi:hypothetical protein
MNETSNACCRAEIPQDGRPLEPTPINKSGVIYDVHIHQVDRGYVVQAGCKTFVFESPESLLDLLRTYILAPDITLKSFYDGTLFPKD